MNTQRLLEGLPGIDTTSPDTYETSDEPARDNLTDGNVEKLDENISKIDASVADVRSTLKDKFIDATNVDFSDAPAKSRKTGYASSYELVAGEETASQKLHRIIAELDELSRDVSSKSQEKADISVSEMMQEIDKLHRRVGTIISSQVSTKLTFPADSKTVGDLSRMITTSSDAGPNTPLYRLYQFPDADKQFHLSKAVELDARLNRIESLLGHTSQSGQIKVGDGSKQVGIADQVAQLEGKLAILDPARLDLIDARLASVLNRMQSVATAAGSASGSEQLDAAKIQKLVQLHELLSSSADSIQTLPKVIDRLTALTELHNQAVQMVDAMAFVEKSQAQLDSQLNTCQQLLEGVSKSLEQSSNDIASYCKRVEQSGAKRKG